MPTAAAAATTIKCLMLGQSGIGKTSFLSNLVDCVRQPPPLPDERHHGERFCIRCDEQATNIEIDNCDITLETCLRDTDLVVNNKIIPSSDKIINMCKYDLVVLCFSLDDINSFDLIKCKWDVEMKKSGHNRRHAFVLFALKSATTSPPIDVALCAADQLNSTYTLSLGQQQHQLQQRRLFKRRSCSVNSDSSTSKLDTSSSNAIPKKQQRKQQQQQQQRSRQAKNKSKANESSSKSCHFTSATNGDTVVADDAEPSSAIGDFVTAEQSLTCNDRSLEVYKKFARSIGAPTSLVMFKFQEPGEHKQASINNVNFVQCLIRAAAAMSATTIRADEKSTTPPTTTTSKEATVGASNSLKAKMNKSFSSPISFLFGSKRLGNRKMPLDEVCDDDDNNGDEDFDLHGDRMNKAFCSSSKNGDDYEETACTHGHRQHIITTAVVGDSAAPQPLQQQQQQLQQQQHEGVAFTIKTKLSRLVIDIGIGLVTCGTGKSRQMNRKMHKLHSPGDPMDDSVTGGVAGKFERGNAQRRTIASTIALGAKSRGKKNKAWLLLASDTSLNTLDDENCYN